MKGKEIDIKKTVPGIPRPRRLEELIADSSQNKVEKKGSFKPQFYVLSEKEGIREFPLSKDCVSFSFGRGEHCDVQIDYAQLSSLQLSAVRLMDEWHFIDGGLRDVVKVEGLTTRQFVSPSNTRVLISCGRSWVVFVGLDAANYQGSDTGALNRAWLEKAPQGRRIIDDAMVRVSLEDKEKQSSFAPIIVGSHKACDFKIDGLKPFHFVLYWNQDGCFLEDMTYASPGVKINNQQAFGPYRLTGSSIAQVGDLQFKLEVEGVVSEQCHLLSEIYKRKPRLSLTAIDGSMSPVLLPHARKLSLGREPKGHIFLEHSSVSRNHAQLTVRDKSLLIEDCESSNGTFINLDRVSPRSVARPGDIIEFGAVPFLLHYELV